MRREQAPAISTMKSMIECTNHEHVHVRVFNGVRTYPEKITDSYGNKDLYRSSRRDAGQCEPVNYDKDKIPTQRVRESDSFQSFACLLSRRYLKAESPAWNT